MLLLIDQNKIDAQLAETQPTYTVTPVNLETPTIRYELPAVDVNSAVTAMPADLECVRARLLSLRQTLIERGVEPLSADDLERKIDETRGR